MEKITPIIPNSSRDFLKKKGYCLTHFIQSAFVIEELKDKVLMRYTTPMKISEMLLIGGAVAFSFYLGARA